MTSSSTRYVGTMETRAPSPRTAGCWCGTAGWNHGSGATPGGLSDRSWRRRGSTPGSSTPTPPLPDAHAHTVAASDFPWLKTLYPCGPIRASPSTHRAYRLAELALSAARPLRPPLVFRRAKRLVEAEIDRRTIGVSMSPHAALWTSRCRAAPPGLLVADGTPLLATRGAPPYTRPTRLCPSRRRALLALLVTTLMSSPPS